MSARSRIYRFLRAGLFILVVWKSRFDVPRDARMRAVVGKLLVCNFTSPGSVFHVRHAHICSQVVSM